MKRRGFLGLVLGAPAVAPIAASAVAAEPVPLPVPALPAPVSKPPCCGFPIRFAILDTGRSQTEITEMSWDCGQSVAFDLLGYPEDLEDIEASCLNSSKIHLTVRWPSGVAATLDGYLLEVIPAAKIGAKFLTRLIVSPTGPFKFL